MNSKEIILEFIENYRRHPVLWYTGAPNYTNKAKRNDAYYDMAEKHSITVKQVKAKIKTLRSYYSREQQKRLSEESGSGVEEYHSPHGLLTVLYSLSETL
ncbi:hypothetical protein LSTR_LSTR004737 [Laodelphax striatellus]|uniref:MADF domain-containing protein n=1 Tax=Laodelphax striatellus TaxID=195883 RepID=A0A482XK21_LAOST|nr:hypothetical protein LSTR_LSTR004737 [Laodelphax striatellus]